MRHIGCVVMNLFLYRKSRGGGGVFLSKPPCQLLLSVRLMGRCGLHFLHSAGVAHRDVKPEFVAQRARLMGQERAVRRGHAAGAAVRLWPVQDAGPQLQHQWAAVSGALMPAGGMCTRQYRAPELQLLRADYSFAVDLWCGDEPGGC